MTQSSLVSLHSDAFCSIERTLEIIGDRWTFLILRDVMVAGVSRFGDFERHLGIPTNTLTNRLAALVDAGIFEKRSYRETGARVRFSYHLTPAGEKLKLVLAALQQWGDEFVPPATGVTLKRQTIGDGRPIRVGFIDDDEHPRDLEDVMFVRTSAYRA